MSVPIVSPISVSIPTCLSTAPPYPDGFPLLRESEETKRGEFDAAAVEIERIKANVEIERMKIDAETKQMEFACRQAEAEVAKLKERARLKEIELEEQTRLRAAELEKTHTRPRAKPASRSNQMTYKPKPRPRPITRWGPCSSLRDMPMKRDGVVYPIPQWKAERTTSAKGRHLSVMQMYRDYTRECGLSPEVLRDYSSPLFREGYQRFFPWFRNLPGIEKGELGAKDLKFIGT